MAKFSSAFIDSLTNPGMLTDARKLGAAIARVPQQYAKVKEKCVYEIDGTRTTCYIKTKRSCAYEYISTTN